MSWSGTIPCIVHNSLGTSIQTVEITHEWSAYNDHKDLGDMNPNATVTAFDAHVGDGGSDLWSLRFIDSLGNTYFRNRKQCDVEENDYNSGGSVVIDLGPCAQGFSINLPVSSSCKNNSYDGC